MNKKITLAKIQNLANELDNQGLFKEADSLTQVMVKIAANVVDVANLPTESDETGETFITVNNEKIQVPISLVGKNQVEVKGKSYTLGYDSGTKNFVLYDKTKMKDFHQLDKDGMLERRQKTPWNLGKALGFNIPNAKLPRVTNLEEKVRKNVVKPVSNTLREIIGDPLRDNVTKPITGVFGRAGEQIGFRSPGMKSKEEAALAHALGESGNRETQPPVKTDDAQPTPGPTPTTEPTPTPEPKPEPIDDIIAKRGAEIKNINSPNDLLFWCMSVGTNNSYSAELAKGVRSNPSAYYNRQNQNNILNWIVKMTESPAVAKINRRIKGFRKDTVQLLYSKIRSTSK
jgi:hypothetical protein